MSTNGDYTYTDIDPYSIISDLDDEPEIGQTDHASESEGRTRTPSRHSSSASSDQTTGRSSERTEDQPSEQTTEDATGATFVEEKTEQSTEPVREQLTEQTTEEPNETEQSNQEPTQIQRLDHSDSQVNGSVLQCWPSRVLVTGSGLTGGVLGQELTYNVDVRNAGPGELTAFCTGPNQLAYCELRDDGDGTFTLNVKPEEIGEHVLQVEYEGQPVLGSPFTFAVTANMSSDNVTKVNDSALQCWPSRVLVTGSGLTGGVLGQELTYHIDARNGGPGVVTAYCTGPKGLAYCELRDRADGTYILVARPEEMGDHVLEVNYEGEPVLGSPFTFAVTANISSDNVTKVNNSALQCWPSRVLVTGSGLTGGVLGQDLTYHIDARNGGPGVVTAYCTGPKRLAYCELRDRGDGTFILVARPEEMGDHVLQVKYEGEPVLGSPFTFPVSASSRPDASRVRVSGPGVENGILSTFQSDFVVDTKGAGAGNLSIKMQGPKGAFRMEMSQMNRGERRVFCHYNPRSPGVYIIIVKWSHVDVPGSPFKVKIYDNPEEMDKDLQRQN